jgi:hypothetical protein
VADLSPGRIPPWPDLRFLLGNFSSLVYCPFVRPRVRDSDSQSEDFKKSRVFRSTPTDMVRVKQLRRSSVRQQAKRLGKTNVAMLDATGLPSSAHTKFRLGTTTISNYTCWLQNLLPNMQVLCIS